MTCAKALGCGVPVGAFVLGKKAARSSLEPGDHGTTYGGNPFACAAVSAVFDLFEERELLSHVREVTPYLEQKLDALIERHGFLKERRGRGLMQGVQVEDGRPVGKILQRALENGLILLSAEGNVLRFLPPLIITEEEIDEMIRRLEASL